MVPPDYSFDDINVVKGADSRVVKGADSRVVKGIVFMSSIPAVESIWFSHVI